MYALFVKIINCWETALENSFFVYKSLALIDIYGEIQFAENEPLMQMIASEVNATSMH